MAALVGLYQNHAITHDEFRTTLIELGLPLEEWPEGAPKPVLYRVWQGVEDVAYVDDDEMPDQEIYLPEIPSMNGKTEEAVA